MATHAMSVPQPHHGAQRLATALRWVARTLSLPVLLFFGLSFFAGASPPPGAAAVGLSPADYLKLALMDLLLAGLLVGWRWEGLGGTITLCGLAISALYYRLLGPYWVMGGSFAIPLAVSSFGLLFVACWLVARPERHLMGRTELAVIASGLALCCCGFGISVFFNQLLGPTWVMGGPLTIPLAIGCVGLLFLLCWLLARPHAPEAAPRGQRMLERIGLAAVGAGFALCAVLAISGLLGAENWMAPTLLAIGQQLGGGLMVGGTLLGIVDAGLRRLGIGG